MYRRTNLGVTKSLAIILIYLFQLVGGIVFLISDGRDEEIRFHARMSCYLCIAEILSVLLLSTLAKIPFIGGIFTVLLWMVTIVYIGVMLLSMIRGLNGAELRIPFFYDLASR